MSAFDSDLKALLDRAAEGVVGDRARLPRVVARVRRRRVARVTGIAAGVVAAAVLAAATPSFVTSERGPRLAPAAPSYSSQEGEYPLIAEGTFEGKRWTLSIVPDPDAAHPEDTESENPEILFEIDGAEPNAGAFETYTSWLTIAPPFHFGLDSGEVAMGMVTEAVSSVTVELADGTSIPAEIFDGGDTPVFGVDYYLAFLPRGATGQVVARDDAGRVTAREALSGVARAPSVELDCSYGGPEEAPQREPGPVLARGTFEGRDWSVTLVEDPDAAHPEDTESENPEVLFRIEGAEPNAGAFETHARWDVLDVAFRGDLRGAAFVIGMAARDVESVTVELRDGRSVDAVLFDGRGIPSEGTQYFLAFFDQLAQGDVVARDATGEVVARTELPDRPQVPDC